MINYKKKVKKIYPTAMHYFERYSSGDHIICDYGLGKSNIIYGFGYSEYDAWKNAYDKIQRKVLSNLSD